MKIKVTVEYSIEDDSLLKAIGKVDKATQLAKSYGDSDGNINVEFVGVEVIKEPSKF